MNAFSEEQTFIRTIIVARLNLKLKKNGTKKSSKRQRYYIATLTDTKKKEELYITL
ncbi:hypothetical protein DPMN_014006 [Dreissena polymorpha]|uniref:Uncharacterized protein n=1 Tax=Dreissena polymorpha TaxID=45954 RepID=A0A9D4NA16_DREPO|nr:hypothetical protein DPMN_014006 [Dreissena polymorpha]